MTLTRSELDRENTGVEILLLPGMAWLLYYDNGPGGPCGQSCRTTCEHARLIIFQDDETMREQVAATTFRNKKARIMMGVVGEYTSGGVFSVEKWATK